MPQPRESTILHECHLAASACGARVFRNNVGFDAERRVRYGLCIGSADLIGWTADGRFLAVECKCAGGRVTVAQRRFLDAVTRAGGVAILAWSAVDVVVGLTTEVERVR